MLRHVGLVATLATLIATAAAAQDYPNKPIKAIVPYGAGQATEAVSVEK